MCHFVRIDSTENMKFENLLVKNFKSNTELLKHTYTSIRNSETTGFKPN